MRKSPIILTSEQENFILKNCTTMYIKDIAAELGVTYDPVYNFIQRNGLKQKKVQRKPVIERRVQHSRKAKVLAGYFNIYERENWAI